MPIKASKTCRTIGDNPVVNHGLNRAKRLDQAVAMTPQQVKAVQKKITDTKK